MRTGTYEQYAAAMAGRDDFYIVDKGDYLVANYKSIMADFPSITEDMTDEERFDAELLRNCRGIIFDAKTKNVIRLPLHKFFNLGEREESRGDNFKPEDVVAVYDKLDGSMIAVFRLGERLVFGTKMGETHMTPDVTAYANRTPGIVEFAELCINGGYTPIFEYTAPKHRIVVNHLEEKLTLLAVRHMITGEYVDLRSLQQQYPYEILHVQP